ncbi:MULTISPECIES: hypothetical protein [unclassified Solwaraspora]|uniref:hypothetical protein n=1 Tax=unclassified Solwaraspora TaxID=2627926 RepID=UPI00259B7D9F|nr:hypothetical protein [Solwaraspora sp. WMMA2056]WJK41398.1 hypothetical protein O7608_02890 [Solwaraspora sp. WMMA2056]
MRRIWSGLLAGAAGTSALNMVTYLDMVGRARPASSTPERSVGRLADTLHVDLGDEQTASNRRAGLGPLLGYATGLGAAALYAVAGPRRAPVWAATGLLAALAMAGSDAPLTLLKVTDPRQWSAADWASDIVPHLAYGLVAAAVLHRLQHRD